MSTCWNTINPPKFTCFNIDNSWKTTNKDTWDGESTNIMFSHIWFTFPEFLCIRLFAFQPVVSCRCSYQYVNKLIKPTFTDLTMCTHISWSYIIYIISYISYDHISWQEDSKWQTGLGGRGSLVIMISHKTPCSIWWAAKLMRLTASCQWKQLQVEHFVFEYSSLEHWCIFTELSDKIRQIIG